MSNQCPICTQVECLDISEKGVYYNIGCTSCGALLSFPKSRFNRADIIRILSMSVPPLGKEHLDYTKN